MRCQHHNYENIAMIRLLQLLIISIITSIGFGSTCLAANSPPTCYVVLNKSPDWSKYDVTVVMYDLTNHKDITSFLLSKATSSKPSVNSIKQSFNCQQYPQISFKVSFQPPIWQNLAGQQYNAKTVWNLTPQLVEPPPNATAITITINFPDDFMSVPALIKNIN